MTTSTTQQCDDKVVSSSPTLSVPPYATTTAPHPRLGPPHVMTMTMRPCPCCVLTHLIPLHAMVAVVPCLSLHTGQQWCLAFALLSPTSRPSCDLASPVLTVLAVSELPLPLPSHPSCSRRLRVAVAPPCSPSPSPSHPHQWGRWNNSTTYTIACVALLFLSSSPLPRPLSLPHSPCDERVMTRTMRTC
jgi:hypothetical protein